MNSIEGYRTRSFSAAVWLIAKGHEAVVRPTEDGGIEYAVPAAPPRLLPDRNGARCERLLPLQDPPQFAQADPLEVSNVKFKRGNDNDRTTSSES
jgi:hypothetical protein